MEKLFELALKTQTVFSHINLLFSLIAWPTIIGYLKDLLLQDRHHFKCEPKPSDFVRQLCYEDYTSTASPLMVPLSFASVTFSTVGFTWLVFISYGVRALWRIRKEQDSERKESLVKWFTWLYLVQVCIRLAVLIVMVALFCRIQTLRFPEEYLCSRRNSTKIPTNQIKNVTCHDMHRKRKSELNNCIIGFMAISIILCLAAIIHLFCRRKHFMEQLLEDPEGDNQTSSSGVARQKNTNHGNTKEPLIVKKCQEELQSYYNTFSKVKIVPWDDSSSILIEKIYTPLSWVRDHRKPSGVTQEELEDYTDMFREDECGHKPTRILIYGWPGIGKSTFCKKAAYDWSKAPEEIPMNFHIVLLIKLEDVCDLEDIHKVLTKSKLLASDGPVSVDSLYDYIINNQDKVLLILDGYDEYSCAKEHSPILEIWRREQLRDCRVIVTTRQMKCDKLRGPSDVEIEIQGFKSSEQIETFAKKFLADEQDLKEFMCYLKERDLLGIAEIPLLLLMLCLVWIEKHHVGLPTSRADIYNSFIQTMLSHMTERSAKSEPAAKMSSKDLEKDLSMIGRFAFESLLDEVRFISCSKLPTDISSSLQQLLQVGLFQIVNITSLTPEKGIFFIHKSVQEFLAAWHVKEEVLSMKDESSMSLSKVDPFKKCDTTLEVLKFVCELSAEAACAVLHHLAAVGRKESFSEFEFSEPLQSTDDLSEDQQQYLKLISHSYFCCSAEKRRELFSKFISFTGGILLLDVNQVNIVANDHLLKHDVIPDFIFFSNEKRNSEKSHGDLITIVKDTNAAVVSCSGEMNAADCLTKWPRRPLNEYFLKKERKIVLHVCQIHKEKSGGSFPTEMLRELLSPTAESTQEKHFGDPLNEHDHQTASCSTEFTDSITGRTPHSLSCVRKIIIFDFEWQEMADLLPFSTSLRDIVISGKPLEAQFTETLVSRITFGERLDRLSLQLINLTAKTAAAIARSLHQAPNLRVLNLSLNPLGNGVRVLSRRLSCVPRLKALLLYGVKMTGERVNELSAAVRQSNISELRTEYHDREGVVKPKGKWPTDKDWRTRWKYWHGSEEEPDPGSVTDSDDEQERGY